MRFLFQVRYVLIDDLLEGSDRCEGIAFIGGCTDTNEFNYLVVKTMRGLGLVYLENQARV